MNRHSQSTATSAMAQATIRPRERLRVRTSSNSISKLMANPLAREDSSCRLASADAWNRGNQCATEPREPRGRHGESWETRSAPGSCKFAFC